MVISKMIAASDELLTKEQLIGTLEQGLGGNFSHQRVLVLIPDHTRSLPLPLLFRQIVKILPDTRQLDFMVALGTHPPLGEESLQNLVGISAEERTTTYKHIGLLNHAWDNPDALAKIGTLTRDQVREIAGEAWHPTLGGDVPVKINRAALAYDHILILGPTFPHEVVGMSGGAKYLFPGISGPEIINVTHWLGALLGVVNTIGISNTPVRAIIHTAAGYLSTPVTLIAVVVQGDGLAGMIIGDQLSAWRLAAEHSAQRHIRWYDTPFKQVLSWAPPMYAELWTAAKAMYKLEPVVADGGEVIIYAPHLDTVSHVHGKYIHEIGYHILPYFLENWDRFKHIPLGVLAHAAHLRGAGRFERGQEFPRLKVTLASKISPAECSKLNLGYLDPAEIDPLKWANREPEGLLFVPKAGERLYRVRH